MKIFKLYKFMLALVAAVLISATASEINSAYAAPAASAANLKGAVSEQTNTVQYYHRHRNRWVAPAVGLGILGLAVGAAAAQNNQYYYNNPNYYYQPPRQKCWVQTGPYQGQGYWAWC